MQEQKWNDDGSIRDAGKVTIGDLVDTYREEILRELKRSFINLCDSQIQQIKQIFDDRPLESATGAWNRVKMIFSQKKAAKEAQEVIEKTINEEMIKWASESENPGTAAQILVAKMESMFDGIAQRMVEVELAYNAVREIAVGAAEGSRPDREMYLAKWRKELESAVESRISAENIGKQKLGEVMKTLGIALGSGVLAAVATKVAVAMSVKAGLIKVAVVLLKLKAWPVLIAAGIGAALGIGDPDKKIKERALRNLEQGIGKASLGIWPEVEKEIEDLINKCREEIIKRVKEFASTRRQGLQNSAQENYRRKEDLEQQITDQKAKIAEIGQCLEELRALHTHADATTSGEWSAA